MAKAIRAGLDTSFLSTGPRTLGTGAQTMMRYPLQPLHHMLSRHAAAGLARIEEQVRHTSRCA